MLVSLMMVTVTFIMSGCGKDASKELANGQSNTVLENSEADVAFHVFSHRGASGEEEESTIASYDLAVMYGSRWIEMDLVTSADGTLWISHDDTAERMTGDERKFADMTDDEIAGLRTSGGASILTMREVLERYYDNTDVGFNIAVRDTLWIDQWESLRSIFDEYLKKDEAFCSRLIIQAQLAKTLQDVKEYNPDIMTLFLATDIDIYNEIMQDDVGLNCIDIIAVNSWYMDKRNANMINEVHDRCKYYCVFTLRTTDDIKDAIDRGIDYYFTDFTAKALMLEERYR